MGELASKITGMMLEMDNSELLILFEVDHAPDSSEWVSASIQSICPRPCDGIIEVVGFWLSPLTPSRFSILCRTLPLVRIMLALTRGVLLDILFVPPCIRVPGVCTQFFVSVQLRFCCHSNGLNMSAKVVAARRSHPEPCARWHALPQARFEEPTTSWKD